MDIQRLRNNFSSIGIVVKYKGDTLEFTLTKGEILILAVYGIEQVLADRFSIPIGLLKSDSQVALTNVNLKK